MEIDKFVDQLSYWDMLLVQQAYMLECIRCNMTDHLLGRAICIHCDDLISAAIIIWAEK
jgi:hypothetical protein